MANNSGITTVTAPTNPDAGGKPLSSSETKAAKAVGECCGGSCQKEVTGQCSTYMSQMNAYCQKAMAPYSDSCSSCGGSGVEGGAPPNSGSNSGEEGTTTEMIDTNPFDLRFDINRDTRAFTTSRDFEGFTGKIGFNNSVYEDITSIFISETDKYQIDAAPVFNSLVDGDYISITLGSDASAYMIFKYISQTDLGLGRTFLVSYVQSLGEFEALDEIIFDLSRAVVMLAPGAVQLNACPDCGGSGLEGGNGMPGLIMAVYNGSAGFAGANNIDIYGVVQPL